VTIAGALGACAPTTDKFFESLCPAPCWYGVVPGQTTREELRKLVPSFPYIPRTEVQWWSDPGHVPSFISLPSPDGSAEVTIDTEGDVVTSIRIQRTADLFLPKDMGLELRDAVSLFGTPDLVILGAGCGGDQHCLALYLVFPAIGTVIAANTAEPLPDIHVPPTLRVTSVAFVEPARVDQYLAEQNRGYSLGCLRDHFSAAWPGYEVLHFPEQLAQCAQ
jgi:hypothetical protein